MLNDVVIGCRDDFFQLFNWFQLFFCEKEIPKIAGQSEQVKIDLF